MSDPPWLSWEHRPARRPPEPPLFSLVADAIAAAGAGQWSCHTEHPWIHVVPAEGKLPDQGWKLHIAGTALSARDILSRALPVLLAGKAQFKLAADLNVLEWLCSNSVRRESAGKFITVYPRDGPDCGIIAERLDSALAGIDGPAVLSDLAYRPGSIVYCRYGAFKARYVAAEGGAIRLALRTPDGSLREDLRQPWFDPPSWAPPPPAGFGGPEEAAGAGAEDVLLGGRFLVTGALRFTARGGIYQAKDLESGEEAVVKQARPGMGAGRDGLDARSFLLNEWSMLHLLAGTGLTPAPVALLWEGGDLFIAEEFLTGTRMDRWARQYQPGPGTPGDRGQLLTVLTGLCDAVAEIHSRDLVIRDLSPSNLFVDGTRVRLCDVEHMAFRGTAPRPVGTPGFMPPEQRNGRVATPEADLYAVGALLHSVCTGVPPLLADDDAGTPAGEGASGDRSTRARVAALLARCAGSSGLLDAMSGVIVALLAANPRERLPLGEASHRLRSVLPAGVAGNVARHRPGAAEGPGGSSGTAGPAVIAAEAPIAGPPAGTRSQARSLIAGMAGHLVGSWNPESAAPWPLMDFGRPERPLDVYSGVAGIIGVLTQPGIRGYCSPGAVVRDAARWLAGRHQLDGTDRPGLYLGNGGIAWALGLAAAQAGPVGTAGPAGSGDSGELATEILSRLRSVKSLPMPGDDLLSGAAGVVAAHAGVLQAADAFGLTPAGRGEVKDRLAGLARQFAAQLTPAGTRAAGTSAGGAAPGVRDYGFAHGTAGIGYGLLTAGAVLGDDGLIEHAGSIASTIMAARAGSGDQAWWPSDSTAWPYTAHWCNGSSGIATFLLRFWWHTGSTVAFDTAVAGARSAIAARAGAPACTCHGLAGAGDLFLDLAAATGDDSYARTAWSLAGQVWDLRARRDGRWLVPSQTGDTGADYSMGFSGVLAFLLRLVHGGTRLWMPGDGADGGLPAFCPTPDGQGMGGETG